MFESTKTSSKEIAKKILRRREGEIALGLFKVGLARVTLAFAKLCEEFVSSHSSTLSTSSQRNHRTFIKNLKSYFGEYDLAEIQRPMIEEYRNHRRQQPLKSNPKATIKGATVNRELECLHCMFQFAITRKYVTENPATGVRHFDERRERPAKRMLTADEEQRIVDAAPPHLRVAIILLVQTGVRTYSEGISLRWDQVDLANQVIHLNGNVKTKASEQPVPLTRLAADVLLEWKKEQGTQSPFLFPSPSNPAKPIGTVKRAWKTTLKNASVSYFPIYNLRHVFCTRLSWVAPDAVVQHAMRHSSPETKRYYQLGLANQVREHLEQVNEKAYEKQSPLGLRALGQKSVQESVMVVEQQEAENRKPLRFRDSAAATEDTSQLEARI
ncbi:MAG TPA: site-specific integrase [Candidatus Acidoferrales bacterium]|nr:site-specific integrase [Candidatus Acidoferrales bacterium]